MRILKLIALLVLVPLAMAGLGYWEHQRATAAATALADVDAAVREAVPKLEELVRRTPTASVRLGDQSMAALVALSRMKQARSNLDDVRPVAALREPLPWAVIVPATLAAALGALALAGIALAGRLARQSRDRLVTVFSIGRRLLPFALVGHATLTLAALAAIAIFEGLGAWHAGRMSQGEIKLMVFAGLAALALLWLALRLVRQLRAMLRMFAPPPIEVLGRAVTPHDAPGLWDEVRALATRLASRVPDHLVVGLDDGFYATSADVRVQPAGSLLRGQTLHVPIACLGLFSRDETDAVIAHELAHFAGADTRYGMLFQPLYDGAERSLGAMWMTMREGDRLHALLFAPAFQLGSFFMDSLHAAVAHWSRLREQAADAASVELVGPQAAASALVRSAAAREPVNAFLGEAFAAPDAATDDLLAALLHHVAATPLTVPDGTLAEQLPHPTDSHPSTRARIDATGVPLPMALAAGTRPVDASIALAAIDARFADGPALRRQLAADLLAESRARHAEYRAELEHAASAVADEMRVTEGGRVRGRVVIGMAVALMLLGAGLAAALMTSATRTAGVWLPMLLLAAGALPGLWLLWLGSRLIRNADLPTIVFTPDHVQFPNTAPIPLTSIVDVTWTVGYGVGITFVFDPDAPLPAVRPKRRGHPGVVAVPKRHQLRLHTTQVRVGGKPLKPAALHELLHAYVAAGHARAALREPPAAPQALPA